MFPNNPEDIGSQDFARKVGVKKYLEHIFADNFADNKENIYRTLFGERDAINTISYGLGVPKELINSSNIGNFEDLVELCYRECSGANSFEINQSNYSAMMDEEINQELKEIFGA